MRNGERERRREGGKEEQGVGKEGGKGGGRKRETSKEREAPEGLVLLKIVSKPTNVRTGVRIQAS